MVLQLQVWAFMLLQEAAGAPVGFDPRAMWSQMGWLGEGCRYHPVPHVGVVDRRDDRPLDRLQRRPQAVPAVRSCRRRRSA